jgi:hypothetical protein
MENINEKLIMTNAEEDLIQILVCMADCLLQNEHAKAIDGTLVKINAPNSEAGSLQGDNLQKSEYK